MKYRITRHEKWLRIIEVEADTEEEALRKFDDGDIVWDETEYVETLLDEPTSCERVQAEGKVSDFAEKPINETVTETEPAKHTPGPWEVGRFEQVLKGYRSINSYEHGRIGIAEVAEYPREHAQALANARLIAAAPDLLTACKGLVSASNELKEGECDCTLCEAVIVAEKEIAKAEGKPTC